MQEFLKHLLPHFGSFVVIVPDKPASQSLRIALLLFMGTKLQFATEAKPSLRGERPHCKGSAGLS